MAKGSPLCRQLVKTSGGSCSEESSCNFQSAMTLTDGHDKRNLNRTIKQAFQLHSGKEVTAFVVMALDKDGNIVKHTTNDVQQCTDGIFASDAEECLRVAHKTSVLQARCDHDLKGHSASSDVDSNVICRDDDLVRIRSAYHDQESYQVSRPTSARTFGSTDGWPSDGESPDASHDRATVDLHTRSLSHTKRPVQLQYLLICESSKVEDFMARALQTMQQMAVKRIAKAWIKGICPKKQATFPYLKKKRERTGGPRESADQPGWWPEHSLCSFVEPDHIKREERINLCLHLLRLRPTPAQLKKWNKGTAEPHQTHVTKGWTEFLKELAPPSIFDEMREPDDKKDERQKLLAQTYDLAKREEEYKNGDIDGDDRFWWHNEALAKALSRKKVRRSCDASVDESDIDSLAESAPPSKRSKRTSVATTPAGSPVTILPRTVGFDDTMQDCKPQDVVEPFTNIGVMPETYSRSASAASSHQPWTQDAKDPQLLMPMNEQVQIPQQQSHSPGPSWVGTPLPNTLHASVGPARPSMLSGGLPVEGPFSAYPGRHNYQFPQQTPGSAPAVFRSPFVTQPQLPAVTTDIYTPPVMPSLAYICQEYYNNISNATYYVQPDNTQSQLLVPGAIDMNTQFNYAVPPNTPFTHYPSGQEPCCNFDPATSYHYQSEPDQPHYLMSGPRHNSPFQAPARVERGFTGHGSGVGGGAHT